MKRTILGILFFVMCAGIIHGEQCSYAGQVIYEVENQCSYTAYRCCSNCYGNLTKEKDRFHKQEAPGCAINSQAGRMYLENATTPCYRMVIKKKRAYGLEDAISGKRGWGGVGYRTKDFCMGEMNRLNNSNRKNYEKIMKYWNNGATAEEVDKECRGVFFGGVRASLGDCYQVNGLWFGDTIFASCEAMHKDACTGDEEKGLECKFFEKIYPEPIFYNGQWL